MHQETEFKNYTKIMTIDVNCSSLTVFIHSPHWNRFSRGLGTCRPHDLSSSCFLPPSPAPVLTRSEAPGFCASEGPGTASKHTHISTSVTKGDQMLKLLQLTFSQQIRDKSDIHRHFLWNVGAYTLEMQIEKQKQTGFFPLLS